MKIADARRLALEKSRVEATMEATRASIPDHPLFNTDDDGPDNTNHDINDYLDGRAILPISYDGGEWEEMVSELSGGKKKYKDHRTRRDRTERMTEAWRDQMNNIADALMAWSLEVEDRGGLDKGVWEEELDANSEYRNIRVVDQFGM